MKRYKRGGLLGKLVEESYLTFGLQHSRAYREFALLFQMQSLQLPCPNPGSALIETHGPFTRASLITRRIRGTRNLVNILQSQSMDAEIWQAIGQTVARFHQHNIYHSDLNAHNILIDSENNVFLIDFDKCEQRPDLGEKSIGWKQSNLDRLLRSLHKENSLHAGLHWDDSQWQLFLEGYRGPPRNAQTS